MKNDANLKMVEAVERERERERVVFSKIGFICGGKNNAAKAATYTNEFEVKEEGKKFNIIIEKRIGNSLQVLLRIIQLAICLSFLRMWKGKIVKDEYG